MIAIARKRAPKAKFYIDSFFKFKLPPCQVATALGECFNYMFDKKNNFKHLHLSFKRIYDALQPGGLFVFDIAEPGRGNGPKQKHTHGL